MRRLISRTTYITALFFRNMTQSLPNDHPTPSPSVLEFLRRFARQFRPQSIAEA